jgi:hypothetical protein
MAHIVARSPGGARGTEPLSGDERDLYANLLLLCPNDHRRIDTEAEWSVERLHETKRRHEAWVEEQLERGLLVVPARQDETAFRRSRIDTWSRDTRTWAYSSLTPLELVENAVDPVTRAAREFLAAIELPGFFVTPLGSQRPNANNIEPSTAGLVLEDFRKQREGVGYRIEFFRNGHVEAVTLLDYCLERGKRMASSSERTAYWPSGDHRLQPKSAGFLPYDDLAELAVGFQWVLFALWKELRLPFRDMVLMTAVLNTGFFGPINQYFRGGRTTGELIDENTNWPSPNGMPGCSRFF